MNKMTTAPPISGWNRVADAIRKVAERLRRTTQTLNDAGVPYAVIGGNAVAEWVGRVDSGAVRFTKDVDILLRREDLPAAIAAMTAAGFEHHVTFGVDMFLDGPDAKPSEAVHVLFAGEVVKETDPVPTPDVDQSEMTETMTVLDLASLVRMELTSFRTDNRMNLQDLVNVDLIDATWVRRYPTPLADRLQVIFDTPEN